jgi:hypothetical protein
MVCSVYLTKSLQEEVDMESVFAVLQAIGAAFAWAWGWIWYGWTTAIDWVTQVGLAQIGITIRETGDIVDYASGIIAIVAATAAIWRIIVRRTEGPRNELKAFYGQMNESVTKLIGHVHRKEQAEMGMVYYAMAQQIHGYKYILGNRRRKVLMQRWKLAQDEYFAAKKRLNQSAAIPTPELQSFQEFLQREYKGLM